MAFEGTVVVASGLCGAGTGGAPPLITGALGRLDTSKEVLKQKAEQVASLFLGTSMAQELAPLGLQFVKTWAPEAAGAKSFAGRFEALIASHNSTSCAQLGELQRLFQRRLDHFRQVLAESMGGDARDWSALWSGACGLFCPGRGVCQDSLSILGRCVEESCARMVRERLGELKLQLPGEDAEDVAELRGQCRARIAQFDEQLGVLLDDVGQISEEIPGSVTLALLQGLEQLLAAALEKLAKREAISQKDALQAALAVEALLSSADSDCNAPTRLGSALKTAASAGPAAVAKKAAIAELLQRRAEEVHYTWARAVVGANEPVASLGSFWKLADDEVGPCCGWGSAKFPAKEGEGKSVAVPIQSSPFVFERLCLAAQSLASAQLQGSAVAAALKAALAECFAAAYEDRPADLARLKRSGMSHLLQWLFDLNFLRITLSAAAVAGSKPLEHLRDLLAQGEAVAFSDPVDRLLYQDLLKASVNNHVQETKVLLAPFFLQNPLYGFLSQAPVTRSNSKGINAGENEGFELQVSFTAPLRPVLPRFPLLPVAMNVNAMSDLDRRLEPRKAAERPQSLMQQAGGLVGGLGSRIGTGFFGAKGEALNVYGRSLPQIWLLHVGGGWRVGEPLWEVLQQRMEAGQGQLRAVQTCWGSRHDLSPLDRSARALRSGTPGAILHKGCRRFRQRGVRRGRPLSGLCEDASQHMVILHVMSPRQRGDGPALHQVPCAPLLLVLGPTSATQEARRQVLRQGWTELARAEGAGFRWSRSSRPGWSLLWREKSAQLHGPEVFCVNGRRMQPVMSIQMMSGSCERCCVGPSSVAQQLATGQAGDFFQLEDEAWGCAAQDNSSCISRIRRLLSCQQIREEDLGGVDWLSLREQMRRALVYAREGQVDGFKEGLHGQLHKITFEAEYGDFMLDMGREDWITKFRGLFAQHLTNPEKAGYFSFVLSWSLTA
ncbi:unnamed protein product [Effrenium voratum]|nr:unnamed protein product [Effrenium voratum]